MLRGLEHLSTLELLFNLLSCPQNRAHLFLGSECQLILQMLRAGARPIAVSEQRFADGLAVLLELDHGIERVAALNPGLSVREAARGDRSDPAQRAGHAVAGEVQ